MNKLEELKEYTVEEYHELYFAGRKDKDEFTYKDTIFAIPDYRVPYLYSKLEPYFKKAEKLDVPYTFEEIGKVILHDDENKEQHCIILKLEFKIQINGWKFIASIDHLPNGNIIRNISGADLPEKFRTAKGYCEHCRTDRRRKSTYVVYNKEEGFKQVGKSCLFLYTGLDLSKIASAMDIWNYIHTYSEMSGEGYDEIYECSRYKCTSCDAREVLALAWKLISIFGYAKKGSNISTISRYSEAEDYLNGYMKRYREKEYRKYKEFVETNNIQFFTKEDYEMADKVIAWVMEQKVTSDYINNLNVIFSNFEEYDKKDSTGKIQHYKHCYMENKYIAIVISSITAYNKAMGIKAEKELKHLKEKSESKYVGKINKKISFVIKDISVITSWETCFGYYPVTNFLYKIIDENNNIFTWKTTKQPNKVLKPQATLIGTVKEHKEYYGVKQTELQKCKITSP